MKKLPRLRPATPQTRRRLLVATAVAAPVAWTFLPVLAFKALLITLFPVSGWQLVLIHPAMLWPYALMAAQLYAVLKRKPALSMILPVIMIVTCVAVGLSRESIILNGNIPWLYNSAVRLTELLTGSEINETVFAEQLAEVCDRSLKIGGGLYFNILLNAFALYLQRPRKAA